jgi:phospholipase A2-like protein
MRVSLAGHWSGPRVAVALLAAVVVALIVLGSLPAVRPDPARAAGVATGPAAAAVTALVAADPAAVAPAGFTAVMGYEPVPTRMTDGTLRSSKPSGACSAPGGGGPFGFETACKVHDYGYDLLRYAGATGEWLPPAARRQLDDMFGRDLHAHCRATRHGLAAFACHIAADAFSAAVAFNSWRQRDGDPGGHGQARRTQIANRSSGAVLAF